MANALARVAMILFALSYFLGGAQAHDPNTHQANDLSSATSKSVILCCDGKDYTIPSHWGRTADGFRVLVGKKWLNVPQDAVVTNMPNPDIEAKVALRCRRLPWCALLPAGSRGMKVSLCSQCCFAPSDLGEHYDSHTEQTLCTACPTKPLPMAPRYKRERRRWGYAGKEVRREAASA